MIPDDEQNDLQASVRRIRRGCLGSAVIFISLTVLMVSASGNLFYLIFLVGAAVSLLLWHFTR
jgi:hypothetical protein